MGDRLLHDPGAFDDLGQEHPARPEEVADHVHPGHERALDDLDRPRRQEPRLLGVLDDPGVDALDEGMGEPLLDRPGPPGQCIAARLRRARPLAR